jgi:hypothetical protein
MAETALKQKEQNNKLTPGELLQKQIDEFDLFSIDSVRPELTYNFLPATIRFKMRMLLNAEEKNARQKHYAQPVEKQNATQHLYNVEMISTLTEEIPEGLPGFNALLMQTGAAGEKDRLKQALRDYFLRDAPVLVLIATDLMNDYTRRTQPDEFFRIV